MVSSSLQLTAAHWSPVVTFTLFILYFILHTTQPWPITKLHEWRVYLQRWFLGFKGMRSVRTLRQKRRSSTKLGSKNCVTIFGAEFGSAAAEYGPIRKKLWRQPSSFKQYFQTKLCTKKMWQNRLRFGRDVVSERAKIFANITVQGCYLHNSKRFMPHLTQGGWRGICGKK